MTITHAGFTFTGVAEEVKFEPWQRQVQYTNVFGNPGVSALDGNRTWREFSVRINTYGSITSAAAFFTYMRSTDARIGTVGTFADSGLQTKSITNVEFLGGTLEEGPLPTAPDGAGYWFGVVVFRFKQLAP